MSDVGRIARELINELKRRGAEITPTMKRQINAAAADMAILERCREAMNAGEAVDTDQYFQLRRAAEESRIALLGESASTGPTTIQIEYIRPGGETAPLKWIDELKDENKRLKAELAELKAKLEPVP
jgi:hypothetical protein